MSTKLDKKFIRKLHKRLIEKEKQFFPSSPESDNVVPSLEHLEEIISNLLWASTKLEEGRSLRFSVTYTRPRLIEHLALVFDFLPKIWSVEEIRKLAPAVPPGGQIGVWSFEYFGLVIWGLLTTSLTGITFEVLDPGRIIISFPMNFRVAEISGEKSGFINSKWNNVILDLVDVRESKEKNLFFDQILSLLYGKIMQEILSQIRLLRHGGTIIFVSDDDKWKRSLEKPITYESKRSFNRVRRIEKGVRGELLTVTKNNEEIIETGLELLASHQYAVSISDAARSITYLTAVDGAVVLSRDFDVLAFGAKINVAQKGRKAEVVTMNLPFERDMNSDSSLSYEFRGKRHLSAARFVINNPDSVAFVVSQDGGITAFAFSNDEKKLSAYKGLELLG